MRPQGQLQIAAGFASSAGMRPDNQDFGAVDMGGPHERSQQGIVAVVADGAGGAAGGRTASELAVRTFLDGYRSQGVLAGVGPAALKVLDAYNLWLHAQAQTTPALLGAATTFTAAVLRARAATILHVGDSRAWLFRSDALTLLTDDHVALQADGGQRLLRALGLESALRLDVATQRLEAHDRFLLSTDGVHGALPYPTLARLLGRRGSPQADAEAIVAAALAAGGHDNATALILDVITVPAPDYSLIAAEMARLPAPPAPAAGEIVDGFELVQAIAESKTARLFLAKDGKDLAVLKFPKFEGAQEGDRERFMREVFLGQRIAHPFVGASLPLADGRQSRLYVAMPYYKGETLERRLLRGPMPVSEAIAVAQKVARGLSALHRAGVAHRDVKPQNIMLLEGDGLKLIDLGVARLAGLEDVDEAETPGTVDYMAPELFGQARGGALSDQYALGVTMYRMLTARLPYGVAAPGERPLFGPTAPVTRSRQDAPAWLGALILRAIALRPEDRFGDLDELIFELEHGAARAAPTGRPRPLFERRPILLWQVLCGLLLLLLAISVLAR